MADEQNNTVLETAPETNAEETKVEENKVVENSYTEQQMQDAIRTRIGQEREKIYKKLGTKDLDSAVNAIKQKEQFELDEKKKRGEFDEIMKQQAEKSNAEITNLKNELQKIKINDSLLSSASKHKANVPDQVVQLLKANVQLNDNGAVEILENNNQPRYNKKGELMTVDEYVEEFLTQNPHFQSATPSGSGSQGNVARVSAKAFNIGDLDMTNPEDRKRYAEYKKERDSKPTVINLT
jgi:polyribonucleotide nucleotidyltransferase